MSHRPTPDLRIPQPVSPELFRERLAALEDWLWRHGPRDLGLGSAPPRPGRLAEDVRALSDVYTVARTQLHDAGDSGHLLAKVFYFLCSDAPKIHLVLHELAHESRLHESRLKDGQLQSSMPTSAHPEPLRIIDAGSGVGATTVGLLLSLNSAQFPRVVVDALDSDRRALSIWSTLARRAAAIAGLSLEVRPREADLRTLAPADLPGPFDLFVTQAVLNELFPPAPPVPAQPHAATPAASPSPADARAAWLAQWAARGLTIAIEPALRETTRPLHAARDLLLAAHHLAAQSPAPQTPAIRVLAPCPHQAACPMLANERDWCHEVRLFEPTPRVAEIQAITHRRDERVKFSFLVLAPVLDIPAAAAEPAGEHNHAALPTVPQHAPQPAAPPLLGRLVSDALNSKGKMERDLCTTAGRLVRLRLLDRERTADNELLATAPRGQSIAIQNAEAPPRIGPAAIVHPI
ncbi:MAG: hypothetical protein NTW19_06655 [Planctomycetota bacterium]|nr:hypothetical protein [Planctomycetota bacterium]